MLDIVEIKTSEAMDLGFNCGTEITIPTRFAYHGKDVDYIKRGNQLVIGRRIEVRIVAVQEEGNIANTLLSVSQVERIHSRTFDVIKQNRCSRWSRTLCSTVSKAVINHLHRILRH